MSRLLGPTFAIILAGGALVLPTMVALPQEKSPIVLGFVTTLTGPEAEYGKGAVNIGNLFADAVNAQGGIDGHKVELYTDDSQEQPDILISGSKRAITEKHAIALFGQDGSGITLALEKAVKSYNVPIFLNYTWGNDNTGPDFPFVFRVGPYNDYVAELEAKYLVHAGYKHVVLFAEETAYGTDFGKALKRAIGGKLTLDVVPYQAQIMDLTPQLSKLAQETPPPDAIMSAGNYQIIYNLQNQVREVGLKSQIVGSWDYPTTPQYWQTAGQNGIGIIYASFSSHNIKLNPVGEKFRDLFKAKYGRTPLFYEYFLWDDLLALQKAIEETHSVEPAKLVEILPKISFEGTMSTIKFEQRQGTTVWNQALIGTLFMKKFTALNQADDQAEVVFEANP